MRKLKYVLLAASALAAGVPPGSAAAQSAADLLIRIEQLENELRQITGTVEQLQYRNQQLEAAMKRMQDDTEYRFQELGRGTPRAGTARAPAPPATQSYASASATPSAAPPATGRRSDAFDPSEHPNAPGAPRTLGNLGGSPAPYAGNVAPSYPAPYPNAAAQRDSGPPAIVAEEPRAGAPIDLTPRGSDPAFGRPGAPAPRTGNGSNYALATAPPSGAPRDVFDLGYGYIQHKDYALAEQTLRDFLVKYPSDRLAPDAEYLIGESLFQRQNYREAADAFLAVSKKYETSQKAPDSLLRLGQSLAALNEKELACATFGEVVRKYPRASAGVRQSAEREQKRDHC
jgi:tol-pal system protein YbgF